MPYAIFAPKACDPDGGTLVEVRYPWPSGVPLAAFLQAGALRLACYGAVAGQGTRLTPYGQVLRLVTPRVDAAALGDAALVVVDAAGNEALRLGITVARPFHVTSTYALRRLCPSVWAVGPRGLDEEGALN